MTIDSTLGESVTFRDPKRATDRQRGQRRTTVIPFNTIDSYLVAAVRIHGTGVRIVQSETLTDPG